MEGKGEVVMEEGRRKGEREMMEIREERKERRDGGGRDERER